MKLSSIPDGRYLRGTFLGVLFALTVFPRHLVSGHSLHDATILTEGAVVAFAVLLLWSLLIEPGLIILALAWRRRHPKG